MKYSNKEDSIHVHLDQDKIYMSEKQYKIDKVYSRLEEKSKFSFDRYIVKIVNGKLSLCDSITSKLLKTYIRDYEYVENQISGDEDQEEEQEQEIWDKYTIKKNIYLFVNTHRTAIISNDNRCDILSEYKTGNCTVYVTSDGVLKLSNKINTWNDLSIMKTI